ncbi:MULTISPECIES: hypothetical protein [unclassified Caballeronia]|uniref:hypothetical protein n=1 Tax=unclassified Caballeronia TaxID=2646786 RepID=UPI0028610A2C|nr:MULTISPECIES: hypothetical protein [unclassified Caballeronia]MDR5753735.1 hypothetical protein [Caballeronia sp. LZ024]MDR5840114.1 hypothetical protein [Caballeronia sp. LZ031]
MRVAVDASGEEETVSSEAFQQQELVHIERMIAELERMPGRRRGVAAHNPVMQPEYWRKRIHALMKSPDATETVVRHAAALLAKLAEPADPPRRRG